MHAMTTSSGGGRKRPKEVTGKTVLFCLVAFFGVVSLVNAVMIRAAVSSFGGLETQSSYKAGLAFAREEASAAAQDRRRGLVSAKIMPAAGGQFGIDISAFDAGGKELIGYSATALLVHPTDARLDRRIDLTPTGRGHYAAQMNARAGQWDLVVDLMRGDERFFRSRERIMLSAGGSK